MTEFLPFAILAERAGFKGLYLILENSELQRQSLLLLGIDPARIVQHATGGTTVVDELLMIQRLMGQHNHGCPGLMKATNHAIRAISGAGEATRRLYIARRGLRIVLNEADVMEALAPYGVEKVYLEDLDLADQLKLGSEANCIIGPHGAGMVAGLYMKEGGSIIEFFAPTYINPCMLGVSLVLSHRFLQVTSHVGAGGEQYPYDRDIVVDIPALRCALLTALGAA